MPDRRVHIGNISETPTKIFTYCNTDPTNCIVAATPTRKDEKHPLKSSLQWKSSSSALDDDTDCEYEDDGTLSSRPKTSRGTSHPSPDAFYDYVIPSPLFRKGAGADKSMSSFLNLEKEKNEIPAETMTSMSRKSADKKSLKTKDRSASKRIQSHDDRTENLERTLRRQDEAIFIGCWLFGSLLRV